MSIELSEQSEQLLAKALKSGHFQEADQVILAALESLAEDLDDLQAVADRAQEPRFTLAEVEAELFPERQAK